MFRNSSWVFPHNLPHQLYDGSPLIGLLVYYFQQVTYSCWKEPNGSWVLRQREKLRPAEQCPFSSADSLILQVMSMFSRGTWDSFSAVHLLSVLTTSLGACEVHMGMPCVFLYVPASVLPGIRIRLYLKWTDFHYVRGVRTNPIRQWWRWLLLYVL